MSLSGNNSNFGRASIFETFHAPRFGGETFEASPVALATKSYSLEPLSADTIVTNGSSVKSPVSVHLLSTKGICQQETTEEEYVMEEDDEEESSSEKAEASLWMSCSPGRDLTDDEDCEKNSSRDMDETTEECGSADEEGKCSDDGDDGGDDDDDDLLLSEVSRKEFIRYGSFPSNAKYLKSNKTSKAVTDKKAVPTRRSAYSFFFREIQNAIRSKDPHITFREISKIVANTWDCLANDVKQTYCQRAEELNSRYKYKYKVASPAKLKSKKAKRSLSSPKNGNELAFETFSESNDSLESSTFKRDNNPKDVNKHEDVNESLNCLSISSISEPSKEEMQEREKKESSCTLFDCVCFKSKPVCTYTKCQNLAVEDPRWECNYCSAQCVVSHCKDVFKAWVANQKTEYCGT